jgi:hypothetical protein
MKTFQILFQFEIFHPKQIIFFLNYKPLPLFYHNISIFTNQLK